MKIRQQGERLSASLDAPAGGAAAQLWDGDRLLWEGRATQGLRLELDAPTWQVPAPLQDLMSLALPHHASWTADKFAPLHTEWLGLATCRLTPDLVRGQWTEPAAVPNSLLPLSIVAGVLHYAQSVFEGAKVFFRRHDGGRIEARTFRSDRNARRMWNSALRMAMPLERTSRQGVNVVQQVFSDLYRDTVRAAVDANIKAGLFAGAFQPIDVDDPTFPWHYAPRALYLRPVLFASGPVLGVRPSDHYTLAVYVTPAGRYRADLVLRVERDRHRAWPGGTGAVKAAANYAPTLLMMKELLDNKLRRTDETPWQEIFDDLLFVDGAGNIEEMGGANVFALHVEGDRVIMRTPPSIDDDAHADTILPGVTRETLVVLAQLLGAEVRVEALPLASILERSKDPAERIAFTTGTAAGVAPVVGLLDRGEFHRLATWDAVDDPSRNRRLSPDPAPDGGALAFGKRLRDVLFRVQLGDERGLRRVAPDHADAILAHVADHRWIESFDVQS